MKKSTHSKFILFSLPILIFLGGISFLAIDTGPVEINNMQEKFFNAVEDDEVVFKGISGRVSSHVQTPSVVRALYMTSWIASAASLRPRVIDLIDVTEANAIVIDIKDDTGNLSYIPSDPFLREIGNYENRISDIQELIATLHEKNIYVIGRVAVFQDPALAKDWPDHAVQTSSGTVWEDRKGISWMDAGSQKVWDYAIAIARDAYAQGFDEINFDYVRYPTDGNLEDMQFPLTKEGSKAKMMKNFFAYIDSNLRTDSKNRMKISADVFGMVTTAKDDLGIGQVLEDITQHVDFVAPMIYPSHYPTGFNGLGNPNEHVYEVIYAAMMGAKEKLEAKKNLEIEKITKKINSETGEVSYISENDKKVKTKIDSIKEKFAYNKMRPWLQDFDYGGEYGVREVRDQMRAVYDTGLESWMMWDPSNKYTVDAYSVQ